MFELLSPFIGIVFLVIVVGLIVLGYARSVYKNAGPDEALVITGKKSKKTIVDGATLEESGQRVVHGQGVFITPFFQKAFKISLRSRAIEITAVAQDRNGSPAVGFNFNSRGGDKFNKKLSQKRAESVRKYLMDKGVDGSRMEPKGYGEEQPIADNRTEEGRSQNRRVEFIIVSQ